MSTRKFFYDTEFMEEPGFLELISLGIIGSSDEDEGFYACNVNARLDLANDWVKENVLPKLPPRPDFKEYSSGGYNGPWMTVESIRNGLFEYLAPSKNNSVDLWGYYADYDHVLLCWLFGRMVDLPPGMPVWTRDIKQLAWHLGDPQLPKHRSDEHNALADAKWNREAYRFLRQYERDVFYPNRIIL